MLFPVIMCGGAGTRLWPASTPEQPKQFLPLFASGSLFQQTARRVAAMRGVDRLVVVAGRAHGAIIERQLAQIGLTADLLLEPQPRDSGPAVAAAAAHIAAIDPGGVLVVVASDHHIPDAAAFAAAIEIATATAADGRIATLGVQPASPSIAYGYILAGAPLVAGFEVAAFVEKPDAATAQRYVSEGRLWNSGNFIARADVLLQAFERHAPSIATAARAALPAAGGSHLRAQFLDAPRQPFDTAVMEKTDRAAVVPVAFEWSDLGSWSAVWAVSERDGDGNAVRGPAILEDCRNCLVFSDGPLATAVGLRDTALILAGGAALICPFADDQAVKALAARAKARSAGR